MIDRFHRMKGLPTASTGKTPPTDPLNSGERRGVLIAVVILVVVIAAGATAWVVFVDRSPTTQTGDVCVSVTVASSTGGGIERACGDAARVWCHAVYAQADPHARAVQARCRASGVLP